MGWDLRYIPAAVLKTYKDNIDHETNISVLQRLGVSVALYGTGSDLQYLLADVGTDYICIIYHCGERY